MQTLSCVRLYIMLKDIRPWLRYVTTQEINKAAILIVVVVVVVVVVKGATYSSVGNNHRNILT